jgi:glycosyltransferase involved in cell wall biosynthesis
MKVILSNGFSRFFLSRAAVELCRRDLLACFITGAFPTPFLRRICHLTTLHTRSATAARLLDRGELGLTDRLVRPLWFPELIHQLEALQRRVGPTTWLAREGIIADQACRLYAFQAAKYLNTTTAHIYHYRAGFGHHSVPAAKRRGMLAVCDHSIPHPAVLAHLIHNDGKLPAPRDKGPMNRFWSGIRNDINQADCVIVPSTFVRDTFVHQGWDPARLHIVYFGVDEKFLDSIPPRETQPRTKHDHIRLLFVGEWCKRKGADVLIQALSRIDEARWELEVIGDVEQSLAPHLSAFRLGRRVHLTGTIPRAEVARQMTQADVFVFPSLAEGEARVTGEAAAAGCYVITTANACDIVADGVNGSIVPAGDADALARAIQSTIDNPSMLLEVGLRNASLVRAKYRQRHYGDRLAKLYTRLLSERGNADCSIAN